MLLSCNVSPKPKEAMDGGQKKRKGERGVWGGYQRGVIGRGGFSVAATSCDWVTGVVAVLWLSRPERRGSDGSALAQTGGQIWRLSGCIQVPSDWDWTSVLFMSHKDMRRAQENFSLQVWKGGSRPGGCPAEGGRQKGG